MRSFVVLILAVMWSFPSMADVTKDAVDTCMSVPLKDRASCISVFEQSHHKWVMRCSDNNNVGCSAKERMSGGCSSCVLYPEHVFSSQVVVRPDRVYYRNVSDGGACGEIAQVAVDGQVLMPALYRPGKRPGVDATVRAFLKGKTAAVDKVRPWPSCMRIVKDVDLTRFPMALSEAQKWISGR